MTNVTVSIRAAAIGAAILTAVPAPALGSGWPAQNFSGGQENPLHKVVYAWEPNDEDFLPAYDENYCWQQVWTANGWLWVDVCYGSAF